MRGAPEVALTRNEFHQLPLQPVGNYRRRKLEQLSEWLPREKLYAMPRSLQTQGAGPWAGWRSPTTSSACWPGCDARSRRPPIPTTLYQSVTQTGLALRDNTPRVYVLAAAGGGSSGMLADLGYAVRRCSTSCAIPTQGQCLADVRRPQDPATPKTELANIYATLTEMNHFSDPTVAIRRPVRHRRAAHRRSRRAFHSVYLLPLAIAAPESLDETVPHLGSYLFHELTTPLGLRLDHLRHGRQRPATPAGTMASSAAQLRHLRGLVPARLAVAPGGPPGMPTAHRGLAGQRRIRDLTRNAPPPSTSCATALPPSRNFPDTLARSIEAAASGPTPNDLGVTPAEALTRLLTTLDEQSQQPVAQDDQASWARQAVHRVREWVGAGSEDEQEVNEWRKSRLNRSLAQAAQKLAEQWDQKLVQETAGLMDHPGARLAVAEWPGDCNNSARARVRNFAAGFSSRRFRTNQAWSQLEKAVNECVNGGGGFRLFSRSRLPPAPRPEWESLSQFARQRLAEEMVLGPFVHFFFRLAGQAGGPCPRASVSAASG